MADLSPLERADKVRNAIDERSIVYPLLPPGSLILTPDEVERVRVLIEKGARDDAALSQKWFSPWAWDGALALLAGKGQT